MQRTGNRYKRQKSCTIYISFEERTEDGGAPGYQASYARLNLMYRHRHEDISQVGFYLIETEDDFYNTWRDMPENPSTGMIDEVVVVMHGKYYAMTIHYVADEEGNPIVAEFLTASPDGKVGSDTSALRISDLPVRNIETIRLSSCNTGLLNAINIDCTNDMDSRVESGGKYLVQGNVAQAFLDNQNVHEVYAWDGNTNPRSRYGAERLSHTQDGFHSALKDFEDRDVEFLDIERTVWIDNYHGLWGRVAPMGLVRYVNDDGHQYCYYKYCLPYKYNMYGRVDLETSCVEQFVTEK